MSRWQRPFLAQQRSTSWSEVQLQEPALSNQAHSLQGQGGVSLVVLAADDRGIGSGESVCSGRKAALSEVQATSGGEN